MLGKIKAYLDGYLKKDCQICKWQAETMKGDRFCELCKKCDKPKLCKDNDTLRCSMFREDTTAINNAVSDFGEYLKNGNIDMWKIDR